MVLSLSLHHALSVSLSSFWLSHPLYLSLFLSLYLSVSLSFSLSLSVVHLSLALSLFLHRCLSVSLSVCLSVCLSVSPPLTLASSQNGAIMNRGTGRCLEVENRGLAGIDLTLRSCTGQRWTIKNSIK